MPSPLNASPHAQPPVRSPDDGGGVAVDSSNLRSLPTEYRSGPGLRANRLELEVRAVRRELERLQVELASAQGRERRAIAMFSHDPLTGLPTRAQSDGQACDAVARQTREGSEFAVLIVDLDAFKSINDLHGHDVGDKLLRVVACRLAHAVRAADSVSRRGSDEFVCVLPKVGHPHRAESIARKLRAAVSAPCQIDYLTLCIRPSIGIAMHPSDGGTLELLVENADRAMLWARLQGRGHAHFSDLPVASRSA